ncbi:MULTISPECIES: PaaI family thioesterase [Thermomonospora]|uniref:Thioesterase superfamily protein n=1 Tax=Thermomonospora curvata (strain ATCC 19995 / DSM 43183 / JCM 3096 / KCTC 9072 / NBRC 15933 / NCIMB 10081 / Henssen B9) TaxID=471852 RepID=D1ADB9_THECD|nr:MULTISPECIES: PaaI family thioesterase [Thermomonospora]ACY95629.1 thioesterase superfamily protein [Thermomonospora curvata DSM 43183]PKK16229.1 MAG: PaaI family thioesterase [Thermomonospora sp. CIF 1]
MSDAPELTDETIRVAELPEEQREYVQSMFQSAQLSALLDLRLVEMSPRHALVSMPIAPQAFNSAGRLHGGAIATLIDQAAGTVAARAGDLDLATHNLVTVDMHVRYLARAKGERVYARAEIIKAGSRLITVECKVTDDEEQLVASADFAMMIIPRTDRPRANGQAPES